MVALDAIPTVREGRIQCRGVSKPEGGSTLKLTAKIMISISPVQKFGMDTPVRANTVAILSKMEYCFTAAITPVTTPMIVAKETLNTASVTVAGTLWRISMDTDCFVV